MPRKRMPDPKTLIAKAKKLEASAERIMSGIEPGQPIMGSRDRTRRDRAFEQHIEASRLREQAEKIEQARLVEPVEQVAKPRKKKRSKEQERVAKKEAIGSFLDKIMSNIEATKNPSREQFLSHAKNLKLKRELEKALGHSITWDEFDYAVRMMYREKARKSMRVVKNPRRTFRVSTAKGLRPREIAAASKKEAVAKYARSNKSRVRTKRAPGGGQQYWIGDRHYQVRGKKSPRRRRSNPSYRWLKKEQIKRWVPEAKKRGISKVARSSRGFLAAYKKAGYNPKKLPKEWRDKRNAFIKRHLAQAKKNREDFWKDGKPSRRLVALRIWAYGGR